MTFCERHHTRRSTAFTTNVLFVASVRSRIPRARPTGNGENPPISARFAHSRHGTRGNAALAPMSVDLAPVRIAPFNSRERSLDRSMR